MVKRSMKAPPDLDTLTQTVMRSMFKNDPESPATFPTSKLRFLRYDVTPAQRLCAVDHAEEYAFEPHAPVVEYTDKFGTFAAGANYEAA